MGIFVYGFIKRKDYVIDFMTRRCQMATSSIYENVRLRGNQQVNTFLEAIEASEKEARNNPIQVEDNIVNDTDSINKIFARRKRSAVSQ